MNRERAKEKKAREKIVDETRTRKKNTRKILFPHFLFFLREKKQRRIRERETTRRADKFPDATGDCYVHRASHDGRFTLLKTSERNNRVGGEKEDSLQTDTFSYRDGFCTRENVLYASVGIGCGSLRDFAEEDEDRKNACCLILSELNEEKCFCENKIAPILAQSQANFVSMFLAAYDFCNGLEIYGGWKCSKFPRQAFLQPSAPPPSGTEEVPYPPYSPSIASSSSFYTSPPKKKRWMFAPSLRKIPIRCSLKNATSFRF